MHARALLDPLAKYEDASAGEEGRQACLGYTWQDELLYVVHIERDEATLRIISARSAEASERRRYENE